MSKEKQIEEMAKIPNYCCNEYDENGRHIHNKCNSYDCEYWSNDNFCCCSYGQKEAEALYNAGYRKQSASTVELPFKVGDTLYVPWSWDFQKGVAAVKVEEIKFYNTQMHYMFLIDMESDDECFNQSFGGWKIDRSIGTTVFLTKEDAEAKMK